MDRPTKGKRVVYIAGESPLVEEYAAACLAAGFGVEARFNAGDAGKLPAGAVRKAHPRKETAIGIELTNTARDAKRKNLAEIDRTLTGGSPILSAAAATTVGEQASWISHPERLVGISALPSLLGGALVEIVPAPSAGRQAVEAAQNFYRELGKETSLVHDSPGMVFPRILCMLINEASFALGDRIARRTDIDTAMKLGTHYPRGPLEWGKAIGLDHVRAVLEGLRRDYGEERYRTAPLLARGNIDGVPGS